MKDDLVFHSDRGCQYSSKGYQQLLEENGITGSMNRPGCPYDNACVESFFASLKKEKIYRRRYGTMEEVKKDIFWYIEMFYNRKRRPSNKYLTITSQLKELFYLPLEGDMRIADLVACLKKECRDGGYGMTYDLLRILVMIAYWSGKPEIISDVHSFIMELIPTLVSRRLFSNYEKAENWCREILAETPGTEELRKNYNENLMREDFKHIPRRNVIL